MNVHSSLSFLLIGIERSVNFFTKRAGSEVKRIEKLYSMDIYIGLHIREVSFPVLSKF